MKYILQFMIWAACVANALPVAGQQTPVLNAFSWQPKFLNPAAQGGASGGGVGVLYRSQFSDLPSGSRPVSYLAHADLSPLLSNRIGVGLMVMQDKAHIVTRTNIAGFFGYHLFPQENPFQLSLGASAGVLNQSLELGTATVNDPFDLVLLQGRESKIQFDGGLGAQLQYVQENGSGLYFDLVLPQLFSSDLSYTPTDGSTRQVRFDLLPHILSSLRYRFQGSGIALEPNVVYRETVGKKLKAANFDFHLRAYLLENNLLMIGAGYRLDEGGLIASVGVKPIPSLNLMVSYEKHSALGSTFELGVQYLFGGAGPCKPGPAEAGLDQQKNIAAAARETAVRTAISTRDAVAFAKATLKEAESTLDYQVQQSKLAAADKYIGQTGDQLQKVSAEAKKAAAACAEADRIVKQAAANRRKLCNAAEATNILPSCTETRKIESDLTKEINDLKTQRAAVKTLLNLNDPAVLKNYLAEEIKKLSNKPEDLKISRTSATEIEFQFADPDKKYMGITTNKSFVDFLQIRLAELKNQGIAVESVRLMGDIQTRNASNKVNVNYTGEYGERLQTAYKMNKTGKTSDIKKGTGLTMESLTVLKLFDLKRALAAQIGVAEDKVSLDISSPNPNIEYDLVIRVILTYRK